MECRGERSDTSIWVKEEVTPICEDEPGKTVISIYACLKDANSRSTLQEKNAKRRAVARMDITPAQTEMVCGENGGVSVSVEKVRILPSGSEPARDWREAMGILWSESE
jgi:hypothetical protein